jgi:uridine kinase
VTTASAPWLVAVDGVDGSGKSVLAERLAAALDGAGIASALLRVDDFRSAVDWQRPGRTEADAYYEDYYELEGLEVAGGALLDGAREVAVPVFDARAGRRSGQRPVHLDAAGPRAVVVEGVFARRVALVRSRAAVVYLRTSFAEARRRILARDTARGRSAAEVVHRMDARYFPAQERYMREHDPAGRAAVLVDHERVGAPVITRFDARDLPGPVEVAVRRALAAFAAPAVVK